MLMLIYWKKSNKNLKIIHFIHFIRKPRMTEIRVNGKIEQIKDLSAFNHYSIHYMSFQTESILNRYAVKGNISYANE
jgi:hypothetical protein